MGVVLILVKPIMLYLMTDIFYGSVWNSIYPNVFVCANKSATRQLR